MTDPTKRKMKMPSWHLPYLEKHNIYKLFHEVARELVIHQPEDHVFFIKYLLTSAVRSVRIPHVILLGSPHINVVELGEMISNEMKLFSITGRMIHSVLPETKRRTRAKAADIISAIQSIIHSNSEQVCEYGWILVGRLLMLPRLAQLSREFIVDCIKTKQEAQKLLDVGILPTHVLYLISPYSPKLTNLIYCKVTTNWPAFRANMLEILEVFKKKLLEVYVDDASFEELTKMCIDLICIERLEKGPKQPRVLILGPRGSGRTTQAKFLAEKLKIVHIDFEYLLCQVWKSDSELGEKLRECGDHVSFNSPLLAKVLNKRLLDIECLRSGWVLTGFPFNVTDFRYMDCLETPPNRVIFLECDLSLCTERILRRRINVDTGSTTAVDAEEKEVLAAKRLAIHPKDRADLLNAELQYYCTQYGAMRKYCGGTAVALNADQPERWVQESILAAVIRDLPGAPARNPFQDQIPTQAELKAVMPYKFVETD